MDFRVRLGAPRPRRPLAFVQPCPMGVTPLPQENPQAVHCFCVCSGSPLLGDLLGVSRSMERDLLSVLSIYPRIFLRVFIVYRLLVGFVFVLLYSIICSRVFVVLI